MLGERDRKKRGNAEDLSAFQHFSFHLCGDFGDYYCGNDRSLYSSIGDFVGVVCAGYAGTPPTGFTVTSSPSETWTLFTFVTNGASPANYMQVAWAEIGTAGSHTFTCTGNASSTYQSALPFDFGGTLGTVNGSVSNYQSSPGSTLCAAPACYRSSSLAVSQRALMILCEDEAGAPAAAFPGPFTPGGYVNGFAAIGNWGGTNTAVCESYVTTAATTTTGTVLCNTSTGIFGAIGTLFAVNYR